MFDGAGNISSERPNLPARGVRIEFSPTGVSADTVVQKLCIEAREEGRACSVVSSDGTIQAVVMGQGRHAHLEPYAGGRDQTDR